MVSQIEHSSCTATAGEDPSSPPHSTIHSVIFSSFSGPGGDWLKLFLIGGVLEMLRRFIMHVWRNLVNQFWITVKFKDHNESYYWMMVWLSKNPAWTRAKELSITTDSYRVGSKAVLVEGEADDPSQRKIGFLPDYDCSASIWYLGHYIRASRSRIDDGPFFRREILTMRILARDHTIIDKLLLDAKNSWKAAKKELVSIYASNTNNEWQLITTRPKRPLSSITLDSGVKEKVLDDAKDFLNNKKWYAERGIPFRRGYLLYGAPGSGKTSIIQSLAGELGLDVYIVSLSRSGLDDNTLQELFADLPEKCIALMEDIDAAFHHSVSRTSQEKQKEMQLVTGEKTSSDSTPKISLSGLLNALDGVGAQEGRILFATTNRYEMLDAALRRPGRMDVHIEFKLASQQQAAELFRRFYMPDDAAATVAEKDFDDRESDKDSGYSTPPREKLVDVELPESEKTFASVVEDEFSIEGLMRASERFKEYIPDREFSMAALQGYLMRYKGRSRDAIEGVEAWVKDERTRKEATDKDTDAKGDP